MFGNNPTGGGGSGSGDLVGPASSTDNALARFDGTTGKLLQNSSATLNDGGTSISMGGYGTTGVPTITASGGPGVSSINFNSLGQIDFITDSLVRATVDVANSLLINGASSNGTGLTVRGSGTTTNHALSVETSGNTETFYVTDAGNVTATGVAAATMTVTYGGGGAITCSGGIATFDLAASGSIYTGSAVGINTGYGGLMLGSSYRVVWRDNAAWTGGSGNVGLGGATANILEVNNGTNGTLRDIKARAFYYSATVFDSAGTGTPEGAVTAGIGSTFRRTDGGAATSFYVKESGAGNTGWVAK